MSSSSGALASAATTMSAVAFGALIATGIATGMRGCTADTRGDAGTRRAGPREQLAEEEELGALSSESGFEGRMDALSREIGMRGRADAAVASGSASTSDGAVSLESEPADDASALQVELGGLKLMALHKRAVSDGVDGESVEDAMESSDPKAGLIRLIVDVESRRGPADRIRLCLDEGGEACASMISDVLDHALDVLEGLSVSSPRKSRKGLLETMERVESTLEGVDVDWCEGVSRCGVDEMDGLSDLLASVRGVSSSSGASDVSAAVSALRECLDRCGSVVLQSVAVLSGTDGTGCADDVVHALESLRGLSEERLDAVCDDENSE